ncbi:MAG: carboxylating nicotinate-nucleotide diphosphorylase, partial [Rickettsiales bacterium]
IEFINIIKHALTEDIGQGDITSNLLIAEDLQAEMAFVAREEMVACGLFIPELVFAQLDASVVVTLASEEGDFVAQNKVLAVAKGNARILLMGERVALNIMQRMCGVATLTRQYVQAVSDTKAVILDTRKTMVNLRVMDKYAVTVGGGKNHRFRLDDMVLIKDNHISLCGGIKQAIEKARDGTKLPIVLECDTLEQVEEALNMPPDRILLDNMDNSMLRKAVAIVAGKIALEASGGVSLETVGGIAQTGVDYISVGRITHSVSAVDIGADVIYS